MEKRDVKACPDQERLWDLGKSFEFNASVRSLFQATRRTPKASSTAYRWRGCAIESSAFVGEGGHISLKIDLGDGAERLSVDLARIQWLTRREFGVEFLIFNDDGEARLTRYLARSHVH